jgi:hypothetical protein
MRPVEFRSETRTRERPGSPRKTYRVDEAAAQLRCSVWWLKEQARKRRIPYTWIAGSYRFTDEQLDQILQLCAFSPEPDGPVHASAATGTSRSRTRARAADVPRLTARVPRRAQAAASQIAAA